MQIIKVTPANVTFGEVKPGELFVHIRKDGRISEQSLYLKTKSGAVEMDGGGAGRHNDAIAFVNEAVFRIVEGTLTVEGYNV